MIKKIEISAPQIAEEVLCLQGLSYQVEAEIIGFSELPPLKDTVTTIQQSGESFFGYFEQDELCGVISLKIIDTVIDIHRLVVHPKHFRKGIATQLLTFIETFAGMELIKVSTGAKNIPAVTLYEKNNFQKIKEVMIEENLPVAFFEKTLITGEKKRQPQAEDSTHWTA